MVYQDQIDSRVHHDSCISENSNSWCFRFTNPQKYILGVDKKSNHETGVSKSFPFFFMLSFRIWTNVPPRGTMLKSIGSMYGIFTYIYRKNKPNVGNHTIHGSYGKGLLADFWEANFLGDQPESVKLPLEEKNPKRWFVFVNSRWGRFLGSAVFCFWWHFLRVYTSSTSCLATCFSVGIGKACPSVGKWVGVSEFVNSY